MIKLLVRFVSLEIFVTFVGSGTTFSDDGDAEDDDKGCPGSERGEWTDDGYSLKDGDD